MFQTRPFRSPSLCSALHLHHWKQVKNLIRLATFNIFLKDLIFKRIKNAHPQAWIPDNWWCVSSVRKPECCPKASITNRPRQPCGSRHCRRCPCTHWSSQTLLQGASGAPYSLGGSMLCYLKSIFFCQIFACKINPILSPQAVEKLLSAVNLPSKKAKLKQLKEIIARSFDMNKQSCILWALKLLFGCEAILHSMSVKPLLPCLIKCERHFVCLIVFQLALEISRFPSPHRATLFSLLSHLEKVSANEDKIDNKCCLWHLY